MKTKSEEKCDNCQTIKRYEDHWQCMICGRRFTPEEKTLEERLTGDYKVQGAGTG